MCKMWYESVASLLVVVRVWRKFGTLSERLWTGKHCEEEFEGGYIKDIGGDFDS